MKNNKPKIIILLSLMLMLMIQTTMALIITEPQSITNTFKPFKYPSNDLLVSKVVEHPFGDSYNIPEDLAFDFEINFGTDYANYTFDTTAGEKTTDENGIMRVKLKPGETINVDNVDEGTKVTVTEVQNKPGFSIKDVSVTRDGTISSEETLVIDYTNIYKPTPAMPNNVSLTGTKMLEGREWQENDTFAFTLEYQTDSGEWIALDTKTITYNAENTEFNKFDFTESIKVLEFNRLGTHNFRISEVIGELENIAYDETINYFNIEVTDETMDGQLEINKINGYQNITVTENEDKSYLVDVIFNNTYEVEDPLDLNVDVNGIVKIDNTGEQVLGPENFEITMTNTSTNEEVKLTTDQEGKVNFDLIYTKDDIGKTFEYVIKQTNDAKEGVTYSDKEYKVNITITLNENNELVAKILVNDVEVDEILAEFINTYNVDPPIGPPDDISLNVAINKIVNNIGDEKITPEGFEFILENTTTNKKQTVKTDKTGKANIKLEYTSEDIDKTYEYTLKEVDTKLENVTYDKDVYNIKVAIALNEDNVLIPTITVNNKKVNNIVVEFENTYEKYIIEDITVDIDIINKVDNTGKYSIGPENFEFILVEKNAGKSEKTTSDSEGKAKFQLTFTENDIGKTYKYNLSVVEKNISGLTYSKENYDIEVSISLDENHKLVATIKVNGQVLGDIIANFLNVYHVVPDTPSTPETIDITDNTPYIRMMILSGGGLLLIMLLQNTREQKYCFATANITELLIPEEPEEKTVEKVSKKKKNSRKNKYEGKTSDEIYEMIKQKKNNRKSSK